MKKISNYVTVKLPGSDWPHRVWMTTIHQDSCRYAKSDTASRLYNSDVENLAQAAHYFSRDSHGRGYKGCKVCGTADFAAIEAELDERMRAIAAERRQREANRIEEWKQARIDNAMQAAENEYVAGVLALPEYRHGIKIARMRAQQAMLAEIEAEAAR